MAPTVFQQKVYSALKMIPPGKVTTYKYLAQAIGCKSAQAVGQALRRNSFAPKIPCHRVIKNDFTLGGYAGKREGDKINRKKSLLKAEGVEFIDNRLAEVERLFIF